MAQTILTFELGKETLRAVRETAQKNGIQVKEISRKDYNQKLGALAGIQGFSKENTTYNGPEFPLEMMIFSGTDSVNRSLNYGNDGYEMVFARMKEKEANSEK